MDWYGSVLKLAHDLVVERLKDLSIAGPDGDLAGNLPFKKANVIYEENLPSRTDLSDEDPNIPPLYLSQKRILEPWEKLNHRQMVIILSRAQKDSEGIICAGCGRSPELEFMHLDHKTPKVDNGKNTIDNRVLLCAPCNMTKRAFADSFWIARRE